ncbi:MAG TPA: hypothetical protein VFC78_17870 [Tepidisphaeraceae bacterium]|nr:hypothetical protein [Tepidisphaeraceae bacterium]
MMETIEHQFTPTIVGILEKHFGEYAQAVFSASALISYLNIKTKTATKGSKSRASFGNLYALYVLIEDYVKGGFHTSGSYKDYGGANFGPLFRRQRELPFGAKLQNHHLNTRLNDEFKRFYPKCGYEPIVRDDQNGLYWINENALIVDLGKMKFNLALASLEIIHAYAAAKKSAFEGFIADCEKLEAIQRKQPEQVTDFIKALLAPNVDARIFEIVSYAILKAAYSAQSIWWGLTCETVKEDFLILYKTGRTNANDGGIDFVMKPLGRFFQVTETLDVRKYFLDIDKIQRYPITFVVKSHAPPEDVATEIRRQAFKLYRVEKIVAKYMECIEEIINIPILLEKFQEVVTAGRLGDVISEITIQSKVEFNYPHADEDEETSTPR